MAKVGGFVIHMNPMTMINHGFFNFSPTFYHDFYGQNGHQLMAPICGLSANGIKVTYAKVDHTRRQRVTDSAMVLAVVRKQNDSVPIWPMQSKYLDNPTLKNNAAG
jgi:hypothetical protein